MFCSLTMTLGLVLGTALASPPSDAGPELRGPRWQGRASATAQVESTTDLRDPWRGGRGGIASEAAPHAGGTLRDPFGGRGTRAPVPIPAASDAELRRPFGAP